MALATRISAQAAIDAVDAIVDRLDLGGGAAVIEGRDGSQPADPDAATTGSLAFGMTMQDPAFGAGADAAPGGLATANLPISDADDADGTFTITYCRVSTSTTPPTPVTPEIDGSAGTTSSFDFNFNTVAIVAGATVSLTAYTITMPQT